MKQVKTIDSFGDICPVPMLKAERELKSMEPGEQLLLLTDHSCVVKSITDKYKNISIEEPMNGVWEILFTKE